MAVFHNPRLIFQSYDLYVTFADEILANTEESLVKSSQSINIVRW